MPEKYQPKNEILRIKSLSPEVIKEKLNRAKADFIGKPIIPIQNKSGIWYPYFRSSLTDSYPSIDPTYIEDLGDLIVHNVNFGERNIHLHVSEGDRGGGPITHAVARKTGTNYSLANWYAEPLPEDLPGLVFIRTKVGFSGEGYIYLSGIEPGEEYDIIDDILSSGGTAKALAEAIRKAGGIVNDAFFPCEKVNIGGRQVLENIGINVHSLVRIFAELGSPVTVDADE